MWIVTSVLQKPFACVILHVVHTAAFLLAGRRAL